MATNEAILRSWPNSELTITVLSASGQARSSGFDSCLPAWAELPAVTVQVEIKKDGSCEHNLDPAALDIGAPDLFCYEEMPGVATYEDGDELDFLGIDLPAFRYPGSLSS